MSEPKGLLSHYLRFLVLAAVVGGIIFFMVDDIGAFGNAAFAIIGFGAVVLVHEFGHFIVAKMSGIKVEAFSLGFPPILVGILRTENGWRVRILPGLFRKDTKDEDDAGLLSFTIGKKAKAGETEYRIGLIPFGGFVKMLGQEDTKTVEASDDPRSYANKSVGARMAVITAGVSFNAISAVIAFMVVFLVGINRQPAIIGGVVPGSPAAQAGLVSGDEIIAIGDRRGNLEFSDIRMAAALSGRDEEIVLTVKHPDESVEEISLSTKKMELPTGTLRLFGVLPAESLTVAKVTDSNGLFDRTGLIAGDRIVGINSGDVGAYWELEKEIQNALVSSATVTAERQGASGNAELIRTQIPLELNAANKEVKSESDLGHIYSMVPRLRISAVMDEGGNTNKAEEKLSGNDIILNKEAGTKLRTGDIILAVGDVSNPTYKELRDVTTSHEDKELGITVLRHDFSGVESKAEVSVVPKKGADGERVMIGIAVALDAEHTIVAKTIAVEGGPEKLRIPRGAMITAVDGVGVSSFYDCIREIRRNSGHRVTIDYRVDEETAGDVAIMVDKLDDFIAVKSSLAELIPLEPLERLYKVKGPVEAIQLGYRRTVMFIVQAYVTLQRFATGLVSPKNFVGPIGILTISYRIVAERPLIDYIHFLALISAFIAVFNFLPILPFDGGHIVFLAAEKLKGSPVNERIQGMVSYIGLFLVGTLFLYVTFYDVVRSFF